MKSQLFSVREVIAVSVPDTLCFWLGTKGTPSVVATTSPCTEVLKPFNEPMRHIKHFKSNNSFNEGLLKKRKRPGTAPEISEGKGISLVKQHRGNENEEPGRAPSRKGNLAPLQGGAEDCRRSRGLPGEAGDCNYV